MEKTCRTMQTCRFCRLEPCRLELLAHELYCGARKKLSQYREWVMLKFSKGQVGLNHDPLGQQSIAASVTRPQIVKIKTSMSRIPVPIARARKGKSLMKQNENITGAIPRVKR
ncbi:unnamed protein product [Danaus chrysippus]|uniref:(African queen) hypothetical protein n=1 Tax=Danaus chrysippus TaxID=151541 RepID=A0A8J2M9L9_9NEOP|nr:unnamed protein product [Danaus chrysippus]